MPFLALAFYLIYPNVDGAILFVFGFIWNWSASNDLSALFENKRYRMSMLKIVVNLQGLILKPFKKFPAFFKRVLQSLPAGLFWGVVVYINQSEIPWWTTFFGSACFELLQSEMRLFQKQKELPPEIPKELP